MTRDEAAERCKELNSERPDGEPPWTVREVEPGDWHPARPRIPGLPGRDPLKATIETKPKPPQPEDPRGSLSRGIPGYTA